VSVPHGLPPYADGASGVADQVEGLGPRARQALADRLRTLETALSPVGQPGDDDQSLGESLDRVAGLVGRSADRLWLAHAVLAAELPDDVEMSELLVRARLGGTWAALAPLIDRIGAEPRPIDVEVVRGGVTCDVHTTAESTFLSGIQRVVRETTRRWRDARDVRFVGWTRHWTGFRPLQDEEWLRIFDRPLPDELVRTRRTVVVPWESTHLWVEVITDLDRTARLIAMAKHSRNEVGVLGYDSIPVTSSLTVAQGMTSHFSRGLVAARLSERVALISRAAADEFRGVMQMGAGRRDPGPEVAAVPLAVAAAEASETDLAEARAALTLAGAPMLLVVGSHEPRKNHLAVLHAAELLWREGLEFNLVLVGAGSWKATAYDAALGALKEAGRPVQSIRGLPDRLLWAAYRLARATVFPSLNEGFGLPVAESLAVGTPVVTSDFGSMRDIVAPDGTPLGGLLVDPRDDTSITDALRTVLTDDATYERLRAETAQHVGRSWDDYATEVWDFLVDGVRPPGDPATEG
jgi:glycosyltransferase involved in cell wall biosynthesis